ncbi:hypothetical protein CALCODRAFT_508757 [Calocera cornea HHB12733]|uniref:Uncharacterized protein n=1 Tax=Calocera cornea HHB12733 TaxID=1353952 RepID=A0A165G3M1_9BASI|nr:hypothetical protein CALCODRAFT_508757 [Calocera cornea HHB12733]
MAAQETPNVQPVERIWPIGMTTEQGTMAWRNVWVTRAERVAAQWKTEGKVDGEHATSLLAMEKEANWISQNRHANVFETRWPVGPEIGTAVTIPDLLAAAKASIRSTAMNEPTGLESIKNNPEGNREVPSATDAIGANTKASEAEQPAELVQSDSIVLNNQGEHPVAPVDTGLDISTGQVHPTESETGDPSDTVLTDVKQLEKGRGNPEGLKYFNPFFNIHTPPTGRANQPYGQKAAQRGTRSDASEASNTARTIRPPRRKGEQGQHHEGLGAEDLGTADRTSERQASGPRKSSSERHAIDRGSHAFVADTSNFRRAKGKRKPVQVNERFRSEDTEKRNTEDSTPPSPTQKRLPKRALEDDDEADRGALSKGEAGGEGRLRSIGPKRRKPEGRESSGPENTEDQRVLQKKASGGVQATVCDNVRDTHAEEKSPGKGGGAKNKKPVRSRETTATPEEIDDPDPLMAQVMHATIEAAMERYDNARIELMDGWAKTKAAVQEQVDKEDERLAAAFSERARQALIEEAKRTARWLWDMYKSDREDTTGQR